MHTPPRTCRQLRPEDRVTMVAVKQQNYTASAIAVVLGALCEHLHPRAKRNSSATTLYAVFAQGLTKQPDRRGVTRKLACRSTRAHERAATLRFR